MLKVSVIWCVSWIRALVVEPVGRNANWPTKLCSRSGWIKRGYKNVLVINFSNVLERMGVIEMGLKSPHCSGCSILATGLIKLVFHCSGNLPELNWQIENVSNRSTEWGSGNPQKPMWQSPKARRRTTKTIKHFENLILCEVFLKMINSVPLQFVKGVSNERILPDGKLISFLLLNVHRSLHAELTDWWVWWQVWNIRRM